jgi:hypothetical protein
MPEEILTGPPPLGVWRSSCPLFAGIIAAATGYEQFHTLICRDPGSHAGDLVVHRLATRPLRLLASPERHDSRIMAARTPGATPREYRPDWLNLQVSGESHERLPDRAQHKIRTLLCECPNVDRRLRHTNTLAVMTGPVLQLPVARERQLRAS